MNWLYVEIYNEKLFNKLFKSPMSPLSYKHTNILKFPDGSLIQFSSLSKLQKNISTYPPHILIEIINHSHSSPPSPLALHNSLANSYFHFLPIMFSRILKNHASFSFRVNYEKKNLNGWLLCYFYLVTPGWQSSLW